MKELVRVIGGGLAGSEAALRLSDFGYGVELWDIKPERTTAAHRSPDFGELVCSNSLKSELANTAGGQLKREMNLLGSHLLPIAERVRVPSGGALAVDRDRFAAEVTRELRARDNISFVCGSYDTLDDSVPTILATGPLTEAELASARIICSFSTRRRPLSTRTRSIAVCVSRAAGTGSGKAAISTVR